MVPPVAAGRRPLSKRCRNALSLPREEGLEPPPATTLRDESNLGTKAKCLAILLLPLVLSACMDSDDTRATSFMEDSGGNQPFPSNYRTEVLAFMHTYLNNPVGVREAAMADPVQRTVNGRARFVSCLRFAEPHSDGTYRDARERAILFVNGRLDRMLQNASEVCAGAVYAPFPELEKMTR